MVTVQEIMKDDKELIAIENNIFEKLKEIKKLIEIEENNKLKKLKEDKNLINELLESFNKIRINR